MRSLLQVRETVVGTDPGILTLMILFMWKPFRPFLVNESQITTQFLIIWSVQRISSWRAFFFFFCLWNLMILKAKAVSWINNTPGTFLSSLHSHLPQKGRCTQLLGPGLALVPILLNSISKPTKPLHSAKLIAQENLTFPDGKRDVIDRS